MKPELLKLNLLAISLAGGLIGLGGLLLYLLRAQLVPYLRFVLPIPPLGVAVYVFVFNLFNHYNGSLPDKAALLREILTGTLVAALVFGGFSLVMIFLLDWLARQP